MTYTTPCGWVMPPYWLPYCKKSLLMLGREVTLPLQVVIESPKEILKTPDVNEYVQEMQTRMNVHS
jgi:hypothetical protein